MKVDLKFFIFECKNCIKEFHYEELKWIENEYTKECEIECPDCGAHWFGIIHADRELNDWWGDNDDT